LVAKKKLDIGIIGSQDPERNDARLVEETIDKDEMVLAIPNSHPLAGKEKISIWKLKNLELIVSFKNTLSRPALNKLFLKYDIPYIIKHELDDKAMRISMVQHGLGSAFFTYSEIRREVESKWISVLRIEEEELYRDIVLIRPKDSVMSPSVELFYNFLLESK
jgi:DNA-binding transcriptional LysR family regulator